MNIDGPSLVIVKQFKYAINPLFGLLVPQSGRNGVQKRVEVDASLVLNSVQVCDHLVDGGVLGLETWG